MDVCKCAAKISREKRALEKSFRNVNVEETKTEERIHTQIGFDSQPDRKMISADAINQPIRVNAVYSEGGTSVYSLRLEPPDARSLGLREGQVVNGLIASRPDGNVLITKSNRQITLPPNFAATPGPASLSASAMTRSILIIAPAANLNDSH